MKAELTQSELESIAKIVSDTLYKRFTNVGSQKALQEASEAYAKNMLSFYLGESSVSYDVRKMLAPIFSDYLKQSKEIEEILQKFTSSEHFKNLERRQLLMRIAELDAKEDID